MSTNTSKSYEFYRDLCRNQSPALHRSFDERAFSLFLEDGASAARIEVYVPDETWTNITWPRRRLGASWLSDSELLRHEDWNPEQKGPLGLEIPTKEGGNIVPITQVADLQSHVSRGLGFQAFFIRQHNSYSPLSVTHTQFESLLKLKHVSPRFKDYLIYMGERDREMEIAPPRLRCRPISLRDPSQRADTVECMYGLRYVELNGRGDINQPTTRWSLRQSAVRCSYCVEDKSTAWIFIAISRPAEQRLDEYLSERPEQSTRRQCEINLLLFDTAIGNWRPYLIDLATEIDQHAARLLGASPDNRGPIKMEDCGERQALLVLDQKLLSASVAVKSTSESVRTLRDFQAIVQKMEEGDDIEGKDNKTNMDGLSYFCFSEQLRDLDQISERILALRSELQGITALVSSFLDLSNGYALQSLAKESGRENEEMRKLSERMHDLTKKSTEDAAAVKVLTILTLIYLPATVVSNFFSTSFVNSEPPSGSSAHIVISHDWWIFLAASVPLTLATLYIWLVWMRIQAYDRYPWWWLGRRGAVSSEHIHMTGARTYTEKV